MMRSLWVAKTGLESQQVQMDVITNNLANISTNGFKRSRATFEDLMYQTLRQPGGQTSQQTELPTGFQLGTGVRPVATERFFTQGNLQQTGNSKDLAIDGLGFFQVQMPDGTMAYTRDGTFHINNQGQLVTSSGYPLVPTMNIPEDTKVFTVARDGMVSVIQATSPTPVVLGQLQLAMFMNPAGLEAKGENLFSETTASGAATVAAPGSNGMGIVSQNYVETSNVNVVEEMVNMIQTQRAYEINSKAINASDQMLQKIGQLG